MSKKDYVSIAKALSNSVKDGHVTARGRDILAIRMADVFAKDNPRFDSAKFIAACGAH